MLTGKQAEDGLRAALPAAAASSADGAFLQASEEGRERRRIENNAGFAP